MRSWLLSSFRKHIAVFPRKSNVSNYYYKNERESPKLLRSISYAVVVVGSTLGLGLHSIYYADSGTNDINKSKPLYLFNDTYRKKVFFKYEKRIRNQSPPEKVFNYFASFTAPSGEVYMTAADLMRAVVPVFPSSETDAVRGGQLDGDMVSSQLHCPPSEFFMLFDTNSDGLISFSEYIFFVTLLSIPESSFSVAFKMFDLNGDGGIDKAEFKKVMALMRSQNRQGASHRDGRRGGLKVSGSVENGGVLEYFFGKDGNDRLEHDKFVQFLRDLHTEIQRLEFEHYDSKSQGSISAKDFVLSMVASADVRYINKFLNLVDELDNDPYLRDLRVTYQEFNTFAELRRKLQPFSVAIFSYGKANGLLSKEDFKRASYQVCGVSLSDKVIDLVFYVFDSDRDGNLSSEEFLRGVDRQETGVVQSWEKGFGGWISCFLNCTRNCSSKKFMVQW